MKDEPLNKYRKPNTCPYCGYYCDAATILDGDVKTPPKVGDLSFCIRCAGSSEFDENMILKRFNLNWIEDKAYMEKLKDYQNTIKKFLKINPKQ